MAIRSPVFSRDKAFFRLIELPLLLPRAELSHPVYFPLPAVSSESKKTMASILKNF